MFVYGFCRWPWSRSRVLAIFKTPMSRVKCFGHVTRVHAASVRHAAERRYHLYCTGRATTLYIERVRRTTCPVHARYERTRIRNITSIRKMINEEKMAVQRRVQMPRTEWAIFLGAHCPPPIIHDLAAVGGLLRIKILILSWIHTLRKYHTKKSGFFSLICIVKM